MRRCDTDTDGVELIELMFRPCRDQHDWPQPAQCAIVIGIAPMDSAVRIKCLPEMGRLGVTCGDLNKGAGFATVTSY